MRALTYHGVGDLRVETVPDPTLLSPTDAIVEVRLAAICGSDLHVWHGRETGLDTGTVMGHEFLGEVIEVGKDVSRLKRGDRVVSPFTTSCGACFYCSHGLPARCTSGQLFGWVEHGAGLHGGQAELVRIPLADTTLFPLPAELAAEAGLLLGDVLATGWHAAVMGGVSPGAVVAVVGCGPVGLATVREATGGRGADAVLEAVGSPEATTLAFALARPGGTLAAVGVHHEAAFPFSPGAAYDKNLTYRIGRCPVRHYMEQLLPVALRLQAQLASLFTHRMPLDQAPEGYRVFDARKDGCIKVMLHP